MKKSNKLMSFLGKVAEVVFSNSNLPGSVNKSSSTVDSNTGHRKSSKKELLYLIEHHPCITEISLWKNTKLCNLNIEDPSKKEMAKEYLKIMCEVYESHLSSIHDMTPSQISEHMSGSFMAESMPAVLNEIRRKAASESIPYIFLDKISAVASRHIELIADTINDLQLYRGWDCEEDKILAVLDTSYIAIRLIEDEVPRIVNSMNGELKLALSGSKYDRY